MILGWDISSSFVGWTILEEDGTFVRTGHIDLRDEEDMLSKIELVDEQVGGIISQCMQEHGVFLSHYVEERLGSFSAGKTMLQTLMKLAAINAAVSYVVYRASIDLSSHHRNGGGVTVKYLHPSTVKAIMKREGLLIPKGGDKKRLTLDFVSKSVPGWKVELNRNDNPHPFNFDRADSYIVARAGYLRDYLSKDAQGTKDPGPTGLVGTGEHPEG